MKSWAETSKGSGQTIVPVFYAASFFPPGDHSTFQPPAPGSNKAREWVTKMYMFDKQKIVNLKAKTASQGLPQPSRVEVVTALIWKCMMAASRSNSAGVLPRKTFFMTQAMDIRKRAEPPMPENLVGNLVTIIPVQTNCDEHELEVSDVVAELRKGIREFDEGKARRIRGG